MNLYIRVIYLFLRLPWLKTFIKPLEISKHQIRVWPNDLDFNMHVNNGRILTMLDLGRFRLLHDTQLLKPSIKKRWLPVLGSAKVHFLRPLFFWDKLDIHTKVLFWDEKWIYLEQSIYVKEHLKVTAMLKAMFLSKEGERITPQQMMDLLPEPINKPNMPRKLQAWLHAEKERD